MISDVRFLADGAVSFRHNGLQWVLDREGEPSPHRRLLADWLADGNEIAPWRPATSDYEAAARAGIERTAAALGYDSSAALVSYAVSANESWAAEAKAFVAWRDAVWMAAFAAMETNPPMQDFIAALPAWGDAKPSRQAEEGQTVAGFFPQGT